MSGGQQINIKNVNLSEASKSNPYEQLLRTLLDSLDFEEIVQTPKF
jgi:hypothetical protein